MKAKKINSLSERSVKAVVAFMIVTLAFGIFVLFNNYQENIILTGMFQAFMVLVVFGMALLLGLLFLVNKE